MATTQIQERCGNLTKTWMSSANLAAEPFRLFFPIAVIAGVWGVALWPWSLLGSEAAYPGEAHARMMIQGFFGGSIFGFLGTSIPRLMEVAPLSRREAFSLLALFGASVVAIGFGRVAMGDTLFCLQWLAWIGAFVSRYASRKDALPVSFALVGWAAVSSLLGIFLLRAGFDPELYPQWVLLGRHLAYHGFVSLSVLGAGAYVLPRFLSGSVRENTAASASGSVSVFNWVSRGSFARRPHLTAIVVLASYTWETFDGGSLASLVRTGVFAAYFLEVIPRSLWVWNWRGAQAVLLVGVLGVVVGPAIAGIWNPWRVALSHVELGAGSALIVMGVVTRVVLGHTGGRQLLQRSQRRLLIAAFLMLLGLASRITGDFVPVIQRSHFVYGAACWILGVALWASWLLPRVLTPDPDP